MVNARFYYNTLFRSENDDQGGAYHGKQDRPHAVCVQSEWDAMELSRPGYHTLIQAGITDEVVAERLARGTSGDHPRKHTAG
ncbi:MAG TPA: hypothetical protein VKD72_35345 [Gemmataceae bacterium]|nr:hypothetical protein [Gemmataceae bacterium]